MVILGDLLLTLAMGQGESTPLSLMIDHFSDVRARAYNLSLLVTKSKLITFFSAEWPTYQVGWPPEGTFQPSIIQVVKELWLLIPRATEPSPICYGLARSNRRSAQMVKACCSQTP